MNPLLPYITVEPKLAQPAPPYSTQQSALPPTQHTAIQSDIHCNASSLSSSIIFLRQSISPGARQPECTENGNARFLFRLNNGNGNLVTQTCSWLEGRDKKLTICTENGDTWLNPAGSSIRPAREMCKVTCNLCIP